MKVNKIKSYEEFYKLGFDHMIYKKIMGLKKPKIRQHIFYMSLIIGIVVINSVL